MIHEEFVRTLAAEILEGGAGSGNWGHKGRPGKRGGSLPSGKERAVNAMRTLLKEKHPEYRVRENAGSLEMASKALADTLQIEYKPVVATGTPVVAGGIRTVALGITKELAHKGFIDLRGKKCRNVRDVATLCQIYRNPTYEVGRFIYVKEGKVVGVEGATANLPDTSPVFSKKDAVRALKDINDRVKKLGADAVYHVHNHPSGVPIPSRADAEMDWRLSQNVDKYKAGVVIDTGEYYSLKTGPGLMSSTKAKKGIIKTSEPFLKAKIPHPLLGRTITKPADVAGLAKELKDLPDGYVPIIFNSHRVRAIQEIPVGMLNVKKGNVDGAVTNMRNYIRGRLKEFGAMEAFIGLTQYSELGNQVLSRLVENGDLRDAVYNYPDKLVSVKETLEAKGVNTNFRDAGKWHGGVFRARRTPY